MVENKSKVKKALKNKKVNIAVNTNWPFIGPFLTFLEEAGVMKQLMKITGKQIRKSAALHLFALIYIIKIIIGIPKMRGGEVLLGNAGAMNLIGFSVDTVMSGMTKRGKANQYRKNIKKNFESNGCIYT